MSKFSVELLEHIGQPVKVREFRRKCLLFEPNSRLGENRDKHEKLKNLSVVFFEGLVQMQHA